MSLRGWRILLAGFGLASVLVGCTVPPVPTGVRRDDLQDSGEDGWLYDSLRGRDRTPRSDKSSVVISDAENPKPVFSLEEVPSRPADAPYAQHGPADPFYDEDDPENPDGRFRFILYEDGGFRIENLSLEGIGKAVNAVLGNGPDKRIALASFQEGEALYRRGQYAEAAPHFKRATERWPYGSLQEKSLFFLGESRFFADDYPGADTAFTELLAKDPNNSYLDTVAARMFEIGRYWEQAYEDDPDFVNLTDSTRPWLDTYGRAIKAYEAVHQADPTGPLADSALMAAANAYFRKHDFFHAAEYYDMVRKDYPKSEHQLQAHLLGIQARMGMYQGPLYDGTPLEQADKIAEQTLLQFPDRLGDERDRVVDTRNRVTFEKARRDWEMARYFERRGYYGSARFYYQSVTYLYPQTEFAARAEQRLREIADKPVQPPKRFEWLTNIFP